MIKSSAFAMFHGIINAIDIADAKDNKISVWLNDYHTTSVDFILIGAAVQRKATIYLHAPDDIHGIEESFNLYLHDHMGGEVYDAYTQHPKTAEQNAKIIMDYLIGGVVPK